jgi:hypothetical protein
MKMLHLPAVLIFQDHNYNIQRPMRMTKTTDCPARMYATEIAVLGQQKVIIILSLTILHSQSFTVSSD